MRSEELAFHRPPELEARAPPEQRGLPRDGVRLLVSRPSGHEAARFHDLPRFLSPGDLLVVNESATLPASLPAESDSGRFVLNVSTRYGRGIYLVEPRKGVAEPGPLPIRNGESVRVGGTVARFITPYPGLDRLWFLRATEDLGPVMHSLGRPIRYGYADAEYSLDAYQTVFSRVPGSAEMPSGGRPFSRRVLELLRRRGATYTSVLLHAGVSSLEIETDEVSAHPIYPEPFHVSAAAADAINRTRCAGGKVIAVGTTVVRALESAWDGDRIRPAAGFTRFYVHPGHGGRAVDGLLTGFHEPRTSHLAMLYAFAGADLIRSSYRAAIGGGFLWHEFGDSHLILPRPRPEPRSPAIAS